MNRSVSQAATILAVEPAQVKEWAYVFKEQLSETANPPKGQSRSFSDTDLLSFMFIRDRWEAEPDHEAIKIGLNRDEHHEESYIRQLYLHTPLLQDPPDDLDETWRHGILLNGASINEGLELARNYRRSTEVLLELALKESDPFGWACPVLFTCRHTLELYLKLIGEITEFTHSLEKCVLMVEKRYGKKIGSPVREWILELDKLDPGSTTFRYADDHVGTLKGEEFWMDFVQFKFAMSKVFDVIDSTVLSFGAK